MVEKITERIKGKERVILAGDFNFNPDTESGKKIEKFLINIFKDEIRSTFNTRRKENPAFKNVIVDMIYISSDLKIIERYSPDVDVSDHLPLVCVLEI
jgi:endonuclease/exonuclease/phosphatase family metal-dependent hydrolase